MCQKYQILPKQLTGDAIESLCEGYHGMSKVAKILKGINKDLRAEIKGLYKDEKYLLA